MDLHKIKRITLLVVGWVCRMVGICELIIEDDETRTRNGSDQVVAVFAGRFVDVGKEFLYCLRDREGPAESTDYALLCQGIFHL